MSILDLDWTEDDELLVAKMHWGWITDNKAREFETHKEGDNPIIMRSRLIQYTPEEMDWFRKNCMLKTGIEYYFYLAVNTTINIDSWLQNKYMFETECDNPMLLIINDDVIIPGDLIQTYKGIRFITKSYFNKYARGDYKPTKDYL
jgi:hypothetical protein